MIAAILGAEPITEEDLEQMAGAWPEGKDVADFLKAREKWRQEGSI